MKQLFLLISMLLVSCYLGCNNRSQKKERKGEVDVENATVTTQEERSKSLPEQYLRVGRGTLNGVKTFFAVNDSEERSYSRDQYFRIREGIYVDDRTSMDLKDDFILDSIVYYPDSLISAYIHIDIEEYEAIIAASEGRIFNFRLNPQFKKIQKTHLCDLSFEGNDYVGKYIDSMDVVKAGFVINDSYGGED